jgi:hypothetical protein
MKFEAGKKYRFKQDFDTGDRFAPLRYFAKEGEMVIFIGAQSFQSGTWARFKTTETPARLIIISKDETFKMLEQDKDVEICMCNHMRIDHFRGRGKCHLCWENLGRCCSHYEKSDGICEAKDNGRRCTNRGKYYKKLDVTVCHDHATVSSIEKIIHGGKARPFDANRDSMGYSIS